MKPTHWFRTDLDTVMQELQPTFEKEVLIYKGQVVFEKRLMATFRRMPKFFQKYEACLFS